MILNIIFLMVFVAVGVWLIVRGITAGWATSTIVLLCVTSLGAVGRVIAMRRARREPLGPHRFTDDLLRPPQRMRVSRRGLIVCSLIFGIALAWLGSEVRWARINSPQGKFASAREYLEAGRLPSRVTTFTTNGSTFVIAYSPMDCWLALPSGAAAYVFDASGRMVTWSPDTGDDGKFQKDWPLRQQEKALIEDLKRVGFQQEGAANRRQIEGQ